MLFYVKYDSDYEEEEEGETIDDYNPQEDVSISCLM